MSDQYMSVCRGEFAEINDKISRISNKIYDGFDAKITSTNDTVNRLDAQLHGMQKLIIGLLLSVIGGSFTIILSMVFL